MVHQESTRLGPVPIEAEFERRDRRLETTTPLPCCSGDATASRLWRLEMTHMGRGNLIPMTQLYLQVTSVPPGEAPLWVREKWVGLSLPMAQASADPVRRGGFGVISGPKTLHARLIAIVTRKFDMHDGYIVLAADAMAVLERTEPEAAAWWRENASHMLRPGMKFLFERGCGHVTQSRSGP